MSEQAQGAGRAARRCPLLELASHQVRGRLVARQWCC